MSSPSQSEVIKRKDIKFQAGQRQIRSALAEVPFTAILNALTLPEVALLLPEFGVPVHQDCIQDRLAVEAVILEVSRRNKLS
jgi:hypothetical protein